MARKPVKAKAAPKKKPDPKRHIPAILQAISTGQSLRAACRDGKILHDDFPANPTFLLWVAEDEQLAEQYARAMDSRADALFDEMFEIADDGSNDWMETKFGPVLNAEHVQRSKLRVDTRKWALGKMAPKKYGDKLDLNHGGTVNFEGARDGLAEQLAKAAAAIAAAAGAAAGASEPK